MKIAFASSEMVPYAKTGGLADVAGALPLELHARGEEVAAFLPWYRTVRAAGTAVRDTGVELDVDLGFLSASGRVLEADPAPGPRVFFIDAPEFFDRDDLYQTRGRDHFDNAPRFAFFARAVIEAVSKLELEPDVFHANDWQTALIPVYLKTLHAAGPLGKAGTLLTIHNLAYQGVFPEAAFPVTGLPETLFDWTRLEFFGKVNYLKGGIVYAGALNTVSSTYAREILTPAFGAGLEDVLKTREKDLFGVVNGIDTSVWNPGTDPHLPARYAREDLAGKQACKRALCEEAGLDDADAPLFAMISRLAHQKGVDLLAESVDALVSMGAPLVVLGTGDPLYHRMLEKAEKKHPGKVKAFLAFDNALAHRIEAGADVFLMPSRYEPCGLNQLISMRYGTIPVARRTGGLADTVVDAGPDAMASGEATGFVFEKATGKAFVEACARAVEAFGMREAWSRLVRTGMAKDWSWKRAAGEYLDLYRRAGRR